MDRRFRIITLVLFCVLGLTFLGLRISLRSGHCRQGDPHRGGLLHFGPWRERGQAGSHRGAGRGGCDQRCRGVNGVPLKLIMEDTASNPQEAVNVVRKLVADSKVLAIVGPHYSSEAEATFPLGNQLKIVQICVASSKPGLSAANRPYAFRNTLTEDKIGEAVVRKFKKALQH